MAQAIQQGMAGTDWGSIAQAYLSSGWQVDAEARGSSAAVQSKADMDAITVALHAAYLPWLEQQAKRVAAWASDYPNRAKSSARPLTAAPGTVHLFVVFASRSWSSIPEGVAARPVHDHSHYLKELAGGPGVFLAGLIGRHHLGTHDDLYAGLETCAFPIGHQRRTRTSNAIERINQEIKRRTCVDSLFPNEASLLRLVTALLCEINAE